MYVLAIDCGTQSLRGIVFDKKGSTLASKQVIFEANYGDEPGYVEENPYVFYNALCSVVKSLYVSSREVMDLVEGITVTTQRDAAICVDESGEPVRQAILWSDQRRASQPRKMSWFHTTIFTLIGMKRTTEDLSRNCKAHWLMEHEPANWEKTYKYMQLSAFLNLKLTDIFVDGVASQVGHIPFSYKDFRYEKKNSLKHDIFQIDNNKLVPLKQTGEVLGKITMKASMDTGLPVGLKVIASGADKGCETIGVGCMDEETVAISLGSQASVQTTTKRYFETLMFIPPFQSLIPGYYNPEVQIYRGFWMVSWFKNEFAQEEAASAEALDVAVEALLDEALSKIPPGADGLLLQPYWGAGVKLNEAKGAIIGFDDRHTRMHIYRAIIEGIGYALYEGMLKIERKSGKKVNKVMISGGGSQSDVICQIMADIFRLPVHRVQTYETSALGASIAAYVGIGTFGCYEEAIESMVHESAPFVPNKKNTDLYEQIYNRLYKKVYSRLKPLYKVFDRDIRNVL